MLDTLIESLHLIGSIMAVGIVCVAVVAYLIVWPFDHYTNRTPVSLDGDDRE